MSSVPYTALLFDCDGVLVDSESIANALLIEMIGGLGWDITLDDCERLFVGHTVPLVAQIVAERTGRHLDVDEFRTRRNRRLRMSLQAMPGAADLARFADGLLPDGIACASNSLRATLALELQVTGLASIFGDRVHSAEDVALPKPAPDVYLAAMDGQGITPSQALVLDDSPSGVQAAAAAGATVIGFAPQSSGDRLRDHGAKYIVHGHTEVPALLRELLAR